MRNRRRLAGFLALSGSLIVCSAASADWPSSGLPLATGPTNQVRPAGITSANGDLLVFWADVGPAPYALLAQRVTTQGAIASGWPAGGRGIVTPPAAVGSPDVVPDATGGALIAWYDYRATGARGIYGARVGADGVLAPGWSVTGTPICTTTTATGGPLDQLFAICPDGAGGAFVAWTDSRNTPPMSTIVYDVFAQHVRSDGTLDPGWPAGGLSLTGGAGYKYPHALLADSGGGFWLVTEKSFETDRVSVSRHAADGGVIESWATPSFATAPQATGDGSGGVYLTWDGCHGCTLQSLVDGIYAMRLRPGALPAPGWTFGGVPVVVSSRDESQPVVTATSDGAAIVAWLVMGSMGNDWYAARRIEANGIPNASWPSEGTVFAVTNNIFSGRPLIASDGAGGALFAFRRNTPNLFGSAVTRYGAVPPAFPDTGLSLCALTGEQFLTTIVGDGINGAYVLWEDRRDDPPNRFDVYVTRFTREGEIGGDTISAPPEPPPALTISAPFPNPTTGSTSFRIGLATPTPVRLEVLDLSGRVVALPFDGTLPAGAPLVTWDGTIEGRRARAGIYFLRARIGGTAEAVKRVVLFE